MIFSCELDATEAYCCPLKVIYKTPIKEFGENDSQQEVMCIFYQASPYVVMFHLKGIPI